MKYDRTRVQMCIRDSYITAVADDGTVLGYAGLSVVLDEGCIEKVAVKGKYRRMGVADALVDAFVRFGRAHLAFITLEVRASNDAAIQLYMKHGFEQVGRRKKMCIRDSAQPHPPLRRDEALRRGDCAPHR